MPPLTTSVCRRTHLFDFLFGDEMVEFDEFERHAVVV
jgi:hypothetical protein